MNFLGVECHGVSHQLADAQTDLVMHVEERHMLVISWVLFVVDGGETVKSTCHLEDIAHFVLEKSFTTAVVIKAEVG